MKLTVGKKIGGGFCISIIIIAWIGFLSIRNMSLINKNSERMYNNYTVAIKNLADVGYGANAVRLYIMDMLNTDNQAQRMEYQKKTIDSQKTIDEAITAYELSASTEAERIALKDFKNKWPLYMSSAQKSIDMAMAALNAEDTSAIEEKAKKDAVEDVGPKYANMLRSLNDMINVSNEVVRIAPWIAYLNNVRLAIVNMRMDMLNLLNTSDLATREACLEMIRSHIDMGEDSLKMFEGISLTEGEKDQLDAVRGAWKAYGTSTQTVADTALKAARVRGEGNDRWSLNQAARKNEREEAGPKFPPAIAAAATMLSVCDNVAKGLYQDSANKYKSSFLPLCILLLAGVSVGITLGALISMRITRLFRSLVESLTDDANQIASSSDQTSASSQSVSQGTNEQAVSLEATSVSMEEMSSMVKQNADNAKESAQLFILCTNSAEKGNQSVSEMNVAMKEINASSKRIADIIKVIDGIAFQTNMLALNAAVEAARAGEHGKGFAVVAEEVRNLAQRSANAAKDTASLIQDSVRKTEIGANLAERCGGALQEIVTNVKKVSNLVNEIAVACQEQSQGVSQVSKSLSEMEQVTRGNAASAEETASASYRLSIQAKNLMALVEKIAAEISGTHGKIKEGRLAQKPPIAEVRLRRTESSSEQELEAYSEPAEFEGIYSPQSIKPSRIKTGAGRTKGNGRDDGGKHLMRKPEDVIPFNDDVFKNF